MTLIEKTNLVQYVKNDVERVGFLLLFLVCLQNLYQLP